MSRFRRTGHVAVALLVVLVGLLGAPSHALAHGALRRSQPASGAHLAEAPRELRLTFNEAVQLSVARLQLIGPDSTTVALSPLRGGDAAAVIVADITGPLVAGTYTVVWQIAGPDGHPVRDVFRFTIAPGAAGLAAVNDPAVGAQDSTAVRDPEGIAGHHDPVAMPSGGAFGVESPLFAAIRWLGFAATLTLVGVVGFGLLVLPRATRDGGIPAHVGVTIDRRLINLGIASGIAVLAAAVLRLIAQSVAMHSAADALDVGLVATMIGETLWGRAWMLQFAAAAAALAGFTMMRRTRRTRTAGWVLVIGAAVAVAFSASISGHAAAVPDRTTFAIVTDATHVLSAGGWLGTLLVMTLVGLAPVLRLASPERGLGARALLRAFSPVALACAAGVFLTGVIAAWLHLGSVAALATSGYGRTLLVKLGVLSLVFALGAYNWKRVQPVVAEGNGAHRLWRSSWAELGVGALVLVVTAVLVATPTPIHAP